MKITSIRMMRLRGPRNHNVGGGTSKIAKVVIRVDADNGEYGLGECDDFMGVRRGINYMNEYFRGRDAFAVNAIVSEMLYGTVSPHHADAKPGEMPNGLIGIAMCAPTATPWGPVVWAASGVAIALCDLIGKTLKVPAYNLLGGKFRDSVKV